MDNECIGGFFIVVFFVLIFIGIVYMFDILDNIITIHAAAHALKPLLKATSNILPVIKLGN